jgi:hypothetical protein
MGGIVARLYLEFLDGWRDTRSLITFGTPYSGSVNALSFVANGFSKGWGPFTLDLSDMLRSFTSVYQLLPSYRCLAGPGNTWVCLDDDQVQWPDSGMDTARLRESLSMHRELRAAVDARLRAGDQGYVVRPVVGSFQRTGWAARQDGGRIQSLWMRTLREEGGDGTVPMVSAAPHELLDGFKNVAFVSPEDEAVGMEVPDVTADEPLVIRARLHKPVAALVAVVVPVGGGEPQRAKLTDSGDGWWRAELRGLAPADYRVTVGGEGVRPVTDVASIVDLTTLGV